MNSPFVRNLSNVFVTQDDSAIGITSIQHEAGFAERLASSFRSLFLDSFRVAGDPVVRAG
jgi:hypothetical protein